MNTNYAFPPERWLMEVDEIQVGNSVFRCKVVPEGALYTAHCTKCGGHAESVADLRGLDKAQAHALLTGSALEDRLYYFAEEHDDCTTRPKAHVIPGPIESLIQMAIKGSRMIVDRGDTVDAFLAVRVSDPDQPVMLMPVPVHGDFGTHERAVGVAELHFALREHVRANDLDVLGAVLWTEAWIANAKTLDDALNSKVRPAEAEDRREAIVITVMTPTHVKMGMAPIVRASGVQDVGHGTVGDIEWLGDGHFAGIMLEGVMAV